MTDRPDRSEGDDAGVTRHEEELTVGTEVVDSGHVGVRKHVDVEEVHETVARGLESFRDVQRIDANPDDSGEIEQLPDGSTSIPIFEERLVVSKRLVVRERVIVRKTTQTIEEEVHAELRRERVEIDAEGLVEVDPARPASDLGVPDDGTVD